MTDFFMIDPLAAIYLIAIAVSFIALGLDMNRGEI